VNQRPTLGIDSETINDKAGFARLVLIACSDGTYIEPAPGEDRIPTLAALEYIVSRDGELWTFFGDYDINFWLADLPFRALDRLRRTNRVRWRKWQIEHIPRRTFTVKDRLTGRFARIYDAWPFAQSNFVSWLRAWKLASETEIARIQAMKERRAEFARVSKAQILKYTQAEVRYIAAGAETLKERIRSSGYTPGLWLGPGAVASVAMKRAKVKDFMPDISDKRHQHARELAELAYFGGRIETAAVGLVNRKVYAYDIRSAYPAATVALPCLRHAKPAALTAREFLLLAAPANPPALVRIRWELPAGSTWGPFPVRTKTTLRYPTRGEGWFWWREAAAGKWLVENAGGSAEIRAAVAYDVRCDCQPFAWLEDLYNERAARKAAGDPSEYALKLILNSVYGKLAQRVGARPFYCPEWAGMITSATRARLLEVLAAHGDAVLIAATDGVFSTRKLPIESRGLGGWELAGTYKRADIWQPGFYVLDGTRAKTRGFRSFEIDARQFRKAWRENFTHARVEVERTRVVGYRLATSQNRLHDMCRWSTIPAEVAFSPYPRRELLDGVSQGAGIVKRGGELYFRTRAPEGAKNEVDAPDRTILDYADDGEPQGFDRG